MNPPETNVAPNAEPMPPNEYLMRRSYNPEDARVPGAVVRVWRCPVCHERSGRSDHAPRHRCPMADNLLVRLKPYAVDVPLVKTDGEKFS